MKYSTTAVISFALTVAGPALAIPPPEFGFVDSGNHTELGVAYTLNGNTTVVAEGQMFGTNITSQQPSLALNPAAYQSVADYNGQYLILMVDPDASTPSDPSKRFYLHWLAPNVTQSDTASDTLTGRGLTNATENFVPYTPPAPPTDSSAHRYILYAFQQPDNFTIPDAFTSFSASNRASFNLTEFISAASLGRPAAGEYFYVSSESKVPGDFVALAGGQYPGGNGDAVFVGGAASSTTAAASASSSTPTDGTGATGTNTPSAAVTAGVGDAPTGMGPTGQSNPTATGSEAAAAPIATAGLSGMLGVGLLGLAAVL